MRAEENNAKEYKKNHFMCVNERERERERERQGAREREKERERNSDAFRG